MMFSPGMALLANDESTVSDLSIDVVLPATTLGEPSPSTDQPFKSQLSTNSNNNHDKNSDVSPSFRSLLTVTPVSVRLSKKRNISKFTLA
jgi:hypothetical protein